MQGHRISGIRESKGIPDTLALVSSCKISVCDHNKILISLDAIQSWIAFLGEALKVTIWLLNNFSNVRMLFKSMLEWLSYVIRERWGEEWYFFIRIGGGFFIKRNVKFTSFIYLCLTL